MTETHRASHDKPKKTAEEIAGQLGGVASALISGVERRRKDRVFDYKQAGISLKETPRGHNGSLTTLEYMSPGGTRYILRQVKDESDRSTVSLLKKVPRPPLSIEMQPTADTEYHKDGKRPPSGGTWDSVQVDVSINNPGLPPIEGISYIGREELSLDPSEMKAVASDVISGIRAGIRNGVSEQQSAQAEGLNRLLSAR